MKQITEMPEDFKIEPMFERLPFVMDWCNFKGDVCVAQINYEASIKARKPMMDISYCMTRALNQVILRTVQYDKGKFSKCDLSQKDWKIN